MPFNTLEEAVSSASSQRLVVAIWGREKSGKTQMALSFPDPLYFFNFDWGVEHHLPRLQKEGREVYVASYLPTTADISVDDAGAILRAFEQDYTNALSATRKRGGGTLVIDTGTQLWQLVSSCFLEPVRAKRKDSQIYPFDYGKPNQYYAHLINESKQAGANIVLVHRAREVYDAAGKPTGKYEMQGNNQTSYLVQIVLKMDKVAGIYRSTFDSCWQDGALEGKTLLNADYAAIRRELAA